MKDRDKKLIARKFRVHLREYGKQNYQAGSCITESAEDEALEAAAKQYRLLNDLMKELLLTCGSR